MFLKIFVSVGKANVCFGVDNITCSVPGDIKIM